MCFSNSTLTQPKGKVTLNEKLKGFVKNQGDEYCSLCGQYKAKVKIEDKEYNIGEVICLIWLQIHFIISPIICKV